MPQHRKADGVAQKVVDFQGLTLHIENPKGSVRSGVNGEGEKWSRTMKADYGYVEDAKTRADGECLDVYVGPDREAPDAFVVEQLDDAGEFDEYKVLLGWEDEDEAVAVYLEHYPDDWKKHIGDVWGISVDRFKELVEESTPVTKTATFLLIDDVRVIGEKVMNSDKFRQEVEQAAPGKSYDILNPDELDRLNFIQAGFPMPSKFASRFLHRA